MSAVEPRPPEPTLELMARFTVDLAAPAWELGRTTGLGDRRIFPITGGRFDGADGGTRSSLLSGLWAPPAGAPPPTAGRHVV
jgi:hypothetical protein